MKLNKPRLKWKLILLTDKLKTVRADVKDRIALAALKYSGYDEAIRDLRKTNAALCIELDQWKKAADEAERAYEADIDELLKENDGLRQIVDALQRGYDSLYRMLEREWRRGDTNQVPPEEAPADR